MGKTIKFTYADGQKVTQVKETRALNLRSPLSLNIPPGAEVKLDLGLSADHPLALFEPSFAAGRGFQVTTLGIVDAGTKLKVSVKNIGKETLLLDIGDTVARAVALTGEGVYI